MISASQSQIRSKRIKQLRSAGVSIPNIAKELRCSKSTVSYDESTAFNGHFQTPEIVFFQPDEEQDAAYRNQQTADLLAYYNMKYDIGLSL